MATYTVTTDLDSGPGSLREAITQANARAGDDTITFDLDPAERTITLSSGQLVIDNAAAADSGRLTIDGDTNDDGVADITIDADRTSRVVLIQGDGAGDNQAATLDGLVITGGLVEEDGAYGGGLLAQHGDLTITSSIIENNRTEGMYGYDSAGGGISGNGFLTITNSTISGNGAYYGGGLSFGGQVAISKSTINDNYGGAASVSDRLTVTNSTISGNGGFRISAILTDDGLISITNSTITGNTSYGASAISVRGQYGIVHLNNTIVAGNVNYDPFSGEYVDRDIYMAVPRLISNGHNIFGQSGVVGSTAGDLLGIAPADIFAALDGFGGALGDNGGPTRTVALRDWVGNPALDAGATGADIPTDDQRGLGRDAMPDIGAFELDGLLFTAGSDTRNLNLFDLDDYPGSAATRALAGNDRVILSETQNLGVLFAGNAGNDTITGSSSTDRIRGNGGNDTLRGRAGNDTLLGDDGNDSIDGGSGNDRISGGAGGDQLTGGTGKDTAFGHDGADTIDGGSGNDSLIGGNGDDVIDGGSGVDRMRGDLGADRFVLDDGDTGIGALADVVVSFGGLDIIDLELVDARPDLGGDQDFVWRGSAAFTGAGQLRFAVSGADKIIQGTLDADAAPELEIVLLGYAGTPNAGDFDL